MRGRGRRDEGGKGEGQQQVAEVISLPYVGASANTYIDSPNSAAYTRSTGIWQRRCVLIKGIIVFQQWTDHIEIFGDLLYSVTSCPHEKEGVHRRAKY